ncbi:HugZ family protein [Lutibaculum baratangense]|nr:DUF2470 domain-containing protein [Lutibaculum baratangense]
MDAAKDELYDPVPPIRRVMRLARTGGLATLGPDGHPFASLVTVATLPAGEPVLLLSGLAVHTRNLEADPRASLLLVAPGGEGGDPLAGARVTVTGRIVPAEDKALARARFLARHPEAEAYAGFADFGFYRLACDSAHLVAGFGRIHAVPAGEFLVPDGCADLQATEAGAVAHMNEDHLDALELYATRLLGEEPGPWRLSGLDALGLDLVCGVRSARLDFEEPLTRPADLRPVLVQLAKDARAHE